MKKGITKWLIGAFALTMAVVQPASPVPEKLNTVVTAEAATTAPGKIKLKSIKAVTNNRIQINWEKTSGATHYRIFYKQYGAKRWTVLKTTNADTTSYTHISSAKYPIKCGQRYTYTVRAYNSTTRKWGSYDAKGLTTRTVPTTVKLKSIRTDSAKTAVHVSWNRAYGGNYYRIYRRTASAPSWKLIDTVNSSVLSYTDKNPAGGEKNTYTVRMYNSATNVAGGYDANGVSINLPEKEPEMSCSEMEKEIIRLANIKRAKEGLPPLQYNQMLYDLARIRSEQYYRTGADGKILGIPESCYVNDNVISPEKVVNDWMQDSEYRNDILNDAMVYTAVSMYKANDGKTYWVQLYSSYSPEEDYICHIPLNLKGGTCRVNSIMALSEVHFIQEILPTPTRKGYTFKGWAHGDINSPFSLSVWARYCEGLYAVWEPNDSEAEPEPTPTPEPENPETDFNKMAQEVIKLTNEERTKRGIAPLQYSGNLTMLALDRARHYPTTGVGGKYLGIAENSFVSINSISQEKTSTIVNAWMHRSESRETILNKDYKYTGVRIVKGYNGNIYWIQLFTDYYPDQRFSITFDPNNGTCDVTTLLVSLMPPARYRVFSQEELPVPTREGYTFKGWAYKDTIPSTLYIYKDMTLTAVWEPNN